MNPKDCIVRFDTMNWTSPSAHVRQKAHVLEKQQIRIVEFARNMEHPEWCLKGHFGYLLEGTLELEFDGGTIQLNPGDGMIIPAGERYRHRPKSLSVRALLLLCESASR